MTAAPRSLPAIVTDTDGRTVDIYSPDVYVPGPPHDVFERLRRDEPVYRQEMPDGTAYWAVLRHADVVHVARHPTVFSAALGGVVLEDLSEDQLAMMRDMVLAMDPPRHVSYRRGLAGHFKASAMARLEGRVREICRTILAAAADRETVDFVHDVAALLPAQVVGELMGIPEQDWPRIHAWSEQNSGGQDPDIGYSEEALSSAIQRAMYASELAGRRRADPQDDLTSLILAAEVDGAPMSDIGFGSFFVQLVTAGNDTTRTMLSSGLLALLEHADQLEALRADPALIPGAVEEILRWANPLHYFRRTAACDTTIGMQPIAAGEKVAMVYTSANRDDEVFADPHRFDIRRDPNPHLSFGIAEHFCLGVHLARLEGRVFFEELLATFPTISLAGEPRRQRSNLNNALKSLPVRLSRSAA